MHDQNLKSLLTVLSFNSFYYINFVFTILIFKRRIFPFRSIKTGGVRNSANSVRPHCLTPMCVCDQMKALMIALLTFISFLQDLIAYAKKQLFLFAKITYKEKEFFVSNHPLTQHAGFRFCPSSM